MKENNVTHTSERVTSTVPPCTDHSGLPLISNKASGVSGGDQKLSPYGRSLSIQRTAPELASSSWMLLVDLSAGTRH